MELFFMFVSSSYLVSGMYRGRCEGNRHPLGAGAGVSPERGFQVWVPQLFLAKKVLDLDTVDAGCYQGANKLPLVIL